MVGIADHNFADHHKADHHNLADHHNFADHHIFADHHNLADLADHQNLSDHQNLADHHSLAHNTRHYAAVVAAVVAREGSFSSATDSRPPNIPHAALAVERVLLVQQQTQERRTYPSIT